ncbi:MAG: hypothetical protein M0C28_07570 [Candidatus Moduliflexus flocculans]|nr:hypothetical protein [Candidatus Moduliflexus flocculans]
MDDHLELASRRGADASLLVLFGIIALFTSAVTLACYVKFFGMTFTSSRLRMERPEARSREVPAVDAAAQARPRRLVCVVQGLLPVLSIGLVIGRLRDDPRAPSSTPPTLAGSVATTVRLGRGRQPDGSPAGRRSPRRPCRRIVASDPRPWRLAFGAPAAKVGAARRRSRPRPGSAATRT